MPSALVIGSSSGIGQAICERLLAAGWTVTGLARRAAPIDAPGYVHHVADVTAADYRARLVEICAALGPLDACIYSSGIGRLLDLADLAGEADVVATNLLGAVITAEVILPAMIAAGRGHFVGLSSQADRLLDRHAPSYAASKAGMSAYLEGLALACRPHGVHVCNVRFGFVDTAMSSEAGPRPFLISAARAAQIVERSLRGTAIRVTYPRRMGVALWFFRWPARIRIWLS